MIKVIPSILSNDSNEVRELISKCEGLVDRVSIDIIDGVFAQNKTIDPSVLASIETNLKLDFQLMVKEPINWVEKCASAGADRIIGHIEQMGSQMDFVKKVQSVGAGVGLAIDLTTPVAALEPTILNDLDIVLVMSVPAGFGGQVFDKKVYEKIKQLDEIRSRDDTPFVIQVDGGVKEEYVFELKAMNVDEVSVGRGLFNGDLKTNIDKFMSSAYKK